ncbi:hypothetical protein M758_6G104600 [Ceratodon purpureus]|nr:hypothetical protein M758_6G104600 [Ceratodon purpureus]
MISKEHGHNQDEGLVWWQEHSTSQVHPLGTTPSPCTAPSPSPACSSPSTLGPIFSSSPPPPPPSYDPPQDPQALGSQGSEGSEGSGGVSVPKFVKEVSNGGRCGEGAGVYPG